MDRVSVILSHTFTYTVHTYNMTIFQLPTYSRLCVFFVRLPIVNLLSISNKVNGVCLVLPCLYLPVLRLGVLRWVAVRISVALLVCQYHVRCGRNPVHPLFCFLLLTDAVILDHLSNCI
jgi:hypothetical protein